MPAHKSGERTETVRLRCPQGHIWERPAGLSGHKRSGDELLCPECGLPLSTAAEAEGQAETLPPDDSHVPVAPAAEHADERPAGGRDDGYRGRFRILRQHARGGLGTVSIAEDQTLGRQVALKQIRPEMAGRRGSRERFIHEAQVTGQLEHPNIVPVYALGRDERGRPYYAMRFIKGHSLHEAIRRYHEQRQLSQRDDSADRVAFRSLLGRFTAVCQAVAYAHGQGIVHRDLKPANVMLGEYGETLVVDWGIAKRLTDPGSDTLPAGGDRLVDAVPQSEVDAPGDGAGGPHVATPAAAGLTYTGQALGTVSYMAPEQQADPASAGPLADVYSLGAILLELLTGSRSAETGEVPIPQALRPLAAVARKAMSREPHDRYADPRELGREVDAWLADEPVSVYRDALTVRLGRWVKRHRPAAAAAAALLVTALAALVVTNAVVATQKRALVQALHEKEQAVEEAERQLLLANERAQNAAKANLSAAYAYQFGPVEETAPAAIRKHTADLQEAHIRQAVWHSLQTLNDPNDVAAVQRSARRLGIFEDLTNEEPALAGFLPIHDVIDERGEIPLRILTRMGDIRTAQGRYAEAELIRREEIKRAETTPEVTEEQRLVALYNLSFLVWYLEREDAETVLREGFNQSRAAKASQFRNFVMLLGRLLISQGRFDEGTQVLQEFFPPEMVSKVLSTFVLVPQVRLRS
jgi:serine/threonine-protein kinase